MGFKPGAVIWGVAVHVGLTAVVVLVATLLAFLVATFSTMSVDEVASYLWDSWLCPAIGFCVAVAAGRAAGRKAGHLEAIHAIAVVVLELAILQAIARLVGAGSVVPFLLSAPWQSLTSFVPPALGGLSLQLPRLLRERRWRKEGHWKCGQCGFQNQPGSQCAKCGTRESSNGEPLKPRTSACR